MHPELGALLCHFVQRTQIMYTRQSFQGSRPLAGMSTLSSVSSWSSFTVARPRSSLLFSNAPVYQGTVSLCPFSRGPRSAGGLLGGGVGWDDRTCGS